MTLSINNGEYAFLIRLDLILSLSLWKEFQLLQILNELSIKHLIKLGDSWNYMLPILVSSSVKCIAVPILAIAKLNYFERLCLWYHPSLQGTTDSKLAIEAQENCSRL